MLQKFGEVGGSLSHATYGVLEQGCELCRDDSRHSSRRRLWGRTMGLTAVVEPSIMGCFRCVALQKAQS